MVKIYPVILSGGAGSRLWPLSRESFPKQFHSLTGGQTMLQQAALRVADSTQFHTIMIVANNEHRFVIAEQLRQVGIEQPTIILEPMARNTAPAVVAAALYASDADPDALLLIMPADHDIPDQASFLSTVARGVNAARAGSFVLFGVTPESAATGYGYIHAGSAIDEAARHVDAFIEKPSLDIARQLISAGDYYWNSGIFLMPARLMLQELTRHEPQLVGSVRLAFAAASRDMDFLRLDADHFAASPAISLDHALMERTECAAVVPSSFLWSDVGAWSALWRLAEQDEWGNVRVGDTVVEQTTRTYVRSDGPLVATLGVEDLIVVATADAVLVAHREAEQEVKSLVEQLRKSEHPAATGSPRVYRPWGWYEGVHAGERFQVKRLTINPGQRISLQKHLQRAEHWVVVSGTAEVHIDGESRTLDENESVFIPRGATHRLSNRGPSRLNVIEVQTGSYLGEDDIIRFEDDYARA